MKKHYARLLIVFSLSVWGSELRAQNMKIGVVDRQYILNTLSKADKDHLDLEKAEKQLVSEMEKSEKDLEAKRQKHRKANSKGDGASMVSTEKESQQLYSALNARRDELYRRKAELATLRDSKINEAIKQTAFEKQYTSVLDINTVPFYAEEDNISALVLKKLGFVR